MKIDHFFTTAKMISMFVIILPIVTVVWCGNLLHVSISIICWVSRLKWGAWVVNICYEALTSMELKNINEISAFSFYIIQEKILIHIEKLHTKKSSCDSELKYQSLNLKSRFNFHLFGVLLFVLFGISVIFFHPLLSKQF